MEIHGPRWAMKGSWSEVPLGTFKVSRNTEGQRHRRRLGRGRVPVLHRGNSRRLPLNCQRAQKDQKYGMTTRAMTAVAAFKGRPTLTKSLNR